MTSGPGLTGALQAQPRRPLEVTRAQGAESRRGWSPSPRTPLAPHPQPSPASPGPPCPPLLTRCALRACVKVASPSRLALGWGCFQPRGVCPRARGGLARVRVDSELARRLGWARDSVGRQQAKAWLL